MESKKFSIEEALRVGWQKTKENFLFLFCVGFVSFVVSMILNASGKDDSMVAILSFLVSLVFSVFINVGVTKIVLKMLHNEKPLIHIFFEITPSQFFRYLGYTVLHVLCVIAGLILLIVPGVIAAVRLQYGYYLVIEKGMGPVDALKTCWNMTKGETWNLFLYTLVVIVMNIIGALLFFVGLIITAPISLISIGYVYKKLSTSMLPQAETADPHPAVVPPEDPKQDATSNETTPPQNNA